MNASRITTPARPRTLSGAAHGTASHRQPLGRASLLESRLSARPREEVPIVAAVDPSTVRATAETAARLARDLRAPLTFVCARPRPPAMFGEPLYQRRLIRDLVRARRTLDVALAAATRAGVMAHGEIVEGDPADAILKFAAARQPRLLVVGSRRRRFRRSVSRRVIRGAEAPVVVSAANFRSWSCRRADADPNTDSPTADGIAALRPRNAEAKEREETSDV